MLRGFFFEHFHMNRKVSRCLISGFLYSLIATKKSGYPLRINRYEIKSSIIISSLSPV